MSSWYDFKELLSHLNYLMMVALLVFSDCHYKIPETMGLNHINLFSHNSGDW